jgi:CTP:molybdopterin cytidylyltransferase MocA
VAWAIDAALAAGLDATAIVVGAADLEAILPPGLVVLRNDRWAEGQATSLAIAVDWADATGLDAIVVGLGDQPGLGPDAWRAVAAGDGTHPIVVATYDGVRGSPARLDRMVWPLVPRVGDEGARVLMRQRPELVGEVPCAGLPADIDTVEDLDQWS